MTSRGQYILLVEDYPQDTLLTIRALKKSGISGDVTVVNNGKEAVNFLFGQQEYCGRDVTDTPQLIILDLQLPLLNGHDVLREIRSHDVTRFIPVAVLATVNDVNETGDLVPVCAAGANAFLRKPIDFDEFVGAVRSLRQFLPGRSLSA